MTLEENTLIYTDRDENYQLEFDYFPYSELNFYWSPSERYLILDFNSDDLENMIFDRETQIIQNWNYDCNRIARSPRTKNWALWCVSTKPSEEAYAVIESDDTLWISTESPTEILVNKDDLRQNIWRWSPDRQKIAFFDPDDTTGSLHIAEKTRINHILPGSTFEFADALQYTQLDPIQWSESGDLLLIYGRDPENQACPKWKDEFGSGNTYTNVPCWQIVNSQSGDIVWQISKSIELIENKVAEIFPTFTYDSASISPDGNLIAVSYSSGGFRNLFVADIQTGQIISSGWPISPISMRWENESSP